MDDIIKDCSDITIDITSGNMTHEVEVRDNNTRYIYDIIRTLFNMTLMIIVVAGIITGLVFGVIYYPKVFLTIIYVAVVLFLIKVCHHCGTSS